MLYASLAAVTKRWCHLPFCYTPVNVTMALQVADCLLAVAIL